MLCGAPAPGGGVSLGMLLAISNFVLVTETFKFAVTRALLPAVIALDQTSR